MDLEKAYDHVNWDFLLYMVRMSGFGGKWYSWIAHCILVCFSVLVNNTPIGFFSSPCGLRQGYPKTRGPSVSFAICHCDGGIG